MQIEFGWYDDQKTIVYVKILDHPWTWDEYFAVLEEVFALVASVQHPVSGIVVNNTMRFGAQLNNFLKIGKMLPPNLDCIVVVTTNSFIWNINKMFFIIANRMYERYFLTETFAEALAHIERYRAVQNQSKQG